jgi:molybdopterin converting factor small subunit
MLSFEIEMFGLPSNITKFRKIKLKLNEGASLRDLVATLRQAIPALDGPVIKAGEYWLVDHYGFNINGHFYTGKQEFSLKRGDKIALMTLATGG